MSSEPTDASSPRSSRLLRTAAILAALGVAAALAWYAYFRPAPSPTNLPDLKHDFPPGALDGYVPEDAAAVFDLRVRQLLDSPVVRTHLRPQVGGLLARDASSARWLSLVGVSPLADVDEVRAVVSRADPGRPLLLLRGRFDESRFRTGPDQLRLAPRDGFRVYESRGPGTALTYLAPAGDYLLTCASADRLLAALRHALYSGSLLPRDSRLRELNATSPGGRALWLAVSFGALGRVPKLTNLGFEALLRPVIENAAGVEGNMTAGDDLAATFRFEARDEETAAKLEEVLRSACEVAQGAALLHGVDDDLTPVFELLGTGEVTLDGTCVVVRCRLAPGG